MEIMEFTLLKFVAVTIGIIIASVIRRKYPQFPNDKKQVAILIVALIAVSIAVFSLFIS